jgi:hypothetical protein
MQNFPPQATGAAVTQAEPPAEAPREPFNFRFYKPRHNVRERYFIAVIMFLIIIEVVLATAFSIEG